MQKHVTLAKQIEHLSEKKVKISESQKNNVKEFLEASPYEYTIKEVKHLFRKESDCATYEIVDWCEYEEKYYELRNDSFLLLAEIIKIESFIKSQIIYLLADNPKILAAFWPRISKSKYMDQDIVKSLEEKIKLKKKINLVDSFFLYLNTLSFENIKGIFLELYHYDNLWFENTVSYLKKNFFICTDIDRISASPKDIKNIYTKRKKSYEAFCELAFSQSINELHENAYYSSSKALGELLEAYFLEIQDITKKPKNMNKIGDNLGLSSMKKRELVNIIYQDPVFLACKSYVPELPFFNWQNFVFYISEKSLSKYGIANFIDKEKEEIKKSQDMKNKFFLVEQISNILGILKDIRDNISHGKTFVNALVIAKHNEKMRLNLLHYLNVEFGGKYSVLPKVSKYYFDKFTEK